VDNPPASLIQDLAKEVVAVTRVSKDKGSMSMTSPVSGTRSSARGKGSEAKPILQKAVKRAAAKSGTPTPSPLAPFLSLSTSPDLHFLGVADDCGIVLGSHSSSVSEMLSIIRAKEVCQAKIVEALERDSELETPGVPPTSVVGAPVDCPQAEGRNADLD
jgi:hypothetical protein